MLFNNVNLKERIRFENRDFPGISILSNDKGQYKGYELIFDLISI
jgi:hypothetical protein